MCLRFSSALIAFCAQVCTSIFSSCFSLLLLLEGREKGGGRREEGATIGKNCTKKWKKEPLSMYAIFSLLAKSLFWHAFLPFLPSFLPIFSHFFPFLKKK